MTFLAQNGSVFMTHAGGSYELKPDEVAALLDLFDRNRAMKPWLALDEAAQTAGYPASQCSLKGAMAAEADKPKAAA